MTQRGRAYIDIPAATWAAHSEAILARSDVDRYPLGVNVTLRDGSVVIGVRGRLINALPAELFQRLGSSVRSLGRMKMRLRAEALYYDNTVPDLVALAAEPDPAVDLTGCSVKRDVVRAFLRHEFPTLTSPRMTAAAARSWAEGQTLGALQSWAMAHGFWLGHLDSQAAAVEAVLSEEAYQA